MAVRVAQFGVVYGLVNALVGFGVSARLDWVDKMPLAGITANIENSDNIRNLR
jgi:hypothetical protein